MRWALPLVLTILAVPTASAWEATIVATPDAVSFYESPLLAGSLEATAPEGFFGSPAAERLVFDAPATFRFCPDRAGERATEGNCAANDSVTGARIYVRAGGVLVRAVDAPVTLTSRATAAALGGPNVTLNHYDVGPGVYAGGASVVVAQGGAFEIRPLRSDASLEVRGNEGFRTFNGTAYSLFVTDVQEARLEARGAFLMGPGIDVNLTRAGLTRAEQSLRVEELFATVRALQPADRADRRAAIPGAFGLFQLVPALLDGAVASRTNLTLNGELRDEFIFLRLSDMRLSHDGANWTGSGNATYLIEGDTVATRPGAVPALPFLVPILLVASAATARFFTERTPPPRKRRVAAHLVRAGAFVVLAFVAAAALSPLLGFSPLSDAGQLAFRSRVQVTLLIVGIVGTAYVAVGLPVESLARSGFAWRERPRAAVGPALVGAAAALIVVLLAAAPLLSFTARFVRL